MTVIALAAGGTAGHIEPAIACAKAIKDLDSQSQVFIIGTEKGLEKDIVPRRGIELTIIPATPFPRKINSALFSLPFRYLAAQRIAKKLLIDKKVDCVIGFGAYVSLPVYMAARRLKIPVVIHEGNKKAGLANYLGSKFADEVFQMFPESITGAKTVGMPLRKEITNLNVNENKISAYQAFGLDPARKTLLVFGGSQGSQTINKALVGALPELKDLNIQIIHAIGSKNIINESTRNFDFYHPISYIEKMELAYAVADLVISRAGAMTIAEQTVLGIPAIYVPFAVGNGEQTKNVSALIAAGGGILIADNEISSSAISELVSRLILNPAKLQQMSQVSVSHGLRDADIKVAQSALALARGHK